MASGGISLGWIIEAACAQNKKDTRETSSLRYKHQNQPTNQQKTEQKGCQPTNDKLANLLKLIPT